MKMAAPELEGNLKLLKEKVGEMKSKRNYIQMDRDMVEQFYHNTEMEIKEFHTDVLNKEADGEKLQINHNTEVKVFLQKLKLLEYEQEKANINIEDDG
jgi:growth arrest-specific protein 8